MNTETDQKKKPANNRTSITDMNTNRASNVSRSSFSRRSFLQKGLAGAGAVAVGLSVSRAEASGGLTRGDAAILRFLAAAEILESDLWQQYNELCGIQDSEVPGG